MLGILYALFLGGAYTTGKIKNSIEDCEWKKFAIKEKREGRNKGNLYRDHKGIYRDLKTGQPRIKYWNKYGDACLADINGNNVRNVTRERIDEEWKKRCNEAVGNPKAVFYEYWNKKNSRLKENGAICDYVYKDIKTGELYFKKKIEWDIKTKEYCYKISDRPAYAEFYMKITDGTLVGVTDDWNKIQRNFNIVPNDQQIIEFILFFNQKQKEGGWLHYCNHKKNQMKNTNQHEFYLYHY